MKPRWAEITAAEIEAWAGRLIARSVLPQLIRRLIHETAAVDQLHHVDFPAGDEVQRRGWDGLVEATTATPFVSAGRSVWELSATADAQGKADDDYEKRKKDPLGLSQGDTIFVTVSARRWPQKVSWEGTKKSEGVWSDVRALDASDLEQWLETAPATAAWFANQLGRAFDGIEDADAFWDRWSTETNPPLSPEVVACSRDRHADAIRQWVMGPPRLLVVQGETGEEAVAFSVAVLRMMPAEQRIGILDRLGVATTPEAFAVISRSAHPLLIMLLADAPSSRLTASTHHILVALDRTAQLGESVLRLPALDRIALRDELQKIGLSHARAERLAVESGGRLSSLRRLLAASPAAAGPAWAAPAEGPNLVPFLLAGGWDESRTADRDAVGELAGKAYRDVFVVLKRWLAEPGSPLRRVGDIWDWVSRADSWKLLSGFVSKIDLDDFERVSVQVLGAKDPRFDMPPKDRWLAQVQGKVPAHSAALRLGLAETLALLAAIPESDRILDVARARDRAASIVRQLLDNSPLHLWASLSDLLPILAEAAPEVLLDEVDRASLGDAALIRGLFEEEEGPLFAHSHHTGLLWALELLAWEPQYLPRAALILARLARLDPGGKLANRPLSSLREIFLSWNPQTGANLGLRLQALDALLRKEPKVGWKLLLSLLPRFGGDVSIPLPTPKWRDWADNWSQGATWAEQAEFLTGVGDRIATLVTDDPARWADLLEDLHSLRASTRDQLLDRLELDASSGKLSAGGQLWTTLREVIHKHGKYSEAAWALPPSAVDRLDRVFQQLAPTDPAERYAWLFDWHPRLPRPASNDWHEAQRAAETMQREAVLLLAQTQLPVFFVDLVGSVKEPGILGRCLGSAGLTPEFETALLEQILARAGNVADRLLYGFVGGRFATGGWPWADSILASLSAENAPRLARHLPFDRDTWSRVTRRGSEVETAYWRNVVPTWPTAPERDGEEGVQRLLQHNRPWAALFLISSTMDRTPRRSSISATVIADALEKAGSQTPGSDEWALQHVRLDLSELLAMLADTGGVEARRLARIEWLFLAAFQHERQRPATLHRFLETEPAFFAEVVSCIYRKRAPDGSPAEAVPSDEASVSRAQRAFDLLRSWRSVPGATPGGPLDGTVLRDWVKAARDACEAIGRGVTGAQEMGQMLAWAPADPTGVWPHAIVRDLVDELEDPNTEEGVRIGLLNKRGSVWRAHGQGGEQERGLAQQYRTWADAATASPRTAAVLRGVAESYDRQARHEDLRDDAERG